MPASARTSAGARLRERRCGPSGGRAAYVDDARLALTQLELEVPTTLVGRLGPHVARLQPKLADAAKQLETVRGTGYQLNVHISRRARTPRETQSDMFRILSAGLPRSATTIARGGVPR